MSPRDAWTLAAGWSAGVGCTLAATGGPPLAWAAAVVSTVLCASIGARCEPLPDSNRTRPAVSRLTGAGQKTLSDSKPPTVRKPDRPPPGESGVSANPDGTR